MKNVGDPGFAPYRHGDGVLPGHRPLGAEKRDCHDHLGSEPVKETSCLGIQKAELLNRRPLRDAVGVKAFLDETYILGKDSGVTVTLFIPKDVIKKRDSVLVVDDMIKSGETQEALVNLVKKAKAEISGVFSLIAVGEEWKKRLKLGSGSPVEVVTYLKSPLE